MATRLTVILSQAARGDHRAASAEETLLAELMMTAGVDATLVGPLDRIRFESTDYLCLSHLDHHVALLSWAPVEEAARQWQRLKLGGVVVSLGSPSDADSQGRRVHYVSLADGISVILDRVRELRDACRVQAFSIVIPDQARRSTQPSEVGRDSQARGSRWRSPGYDLSDASQDSTPAVDLSDRTGSRDPSGFEIDLDRLVSDLDSLDL